MSSMLTIGVSFLLFFVTLGFMWLIGSHIVFQVIDAIPQLPESSPWRAVYDTNVENVRLIVLFLPGILVLFASIKMLVNASSRGAD